MAGKGRKYRFFILAIAFAVAGCSSPMGSIGGGGGGSNSNSQVYDGILAEPSRRDYNVNDSFKRGDDLKVFTSYRGAKLQPVPVNECVISIIDSPGSMPAPDDPSAGYLFTTTGEKTILVDYYKLNDKFSTQYTITVWDIDDPDNPNNPNNPGNNNQGPEVIIEWA